MRTPERFDYSAIVDRPKLKLPRGARMIAWPIVNVEEWAIERPMPRGISVPPGGVSPIPDTQNWGWHEYGMRVGIWRIMESLRKHRVKPTVSINAKVCETRPRIAGAMRDEGWEFLAHTYEQIPINKIDDQRAMIAQTKAVLTGFVGKAPAGWLGPGRGPLRTLPVVIEWAELSAREHRSLLEPGNPLLEWTVLQPAHLGTAQWDAVRQVVRRELVDAAGEVLPLELRWTSSTAHAVDRVETLELPPGAWLVARVARTSAGLVAEPLSVVHEGKVDCLHFDDLPKDGRGKTRRGKAVEPTDEKGQAIVPAWEADYRTLLDDRYAYADRLRSGENVPFTETAVDGVPITERIETFADDNEMPSCAPPRGSIV